MSKLTMLLFVLACALVQGLKLKNQTPFPYEPESWIGPKMKMRPAILYFNLDDRITEFYINQNRIPLQFPDKDANSWALTKKMEMYLNPGDIIKIVGKNDGGLSGLVGSIHVFNKHNEEKIFNTGRGWFCNGKEARLRGSNDSKTWEYMPLIEKNAQWIWDQKETSKDEAVTCVFKIPCFI